MPDVSVFPFSLAVVANQRFIEIPLLPEAHTLSEPGRRQVYRLWMSSVE